MEPIKEENPGTSPEIITTEPLQQTPIEVELEKERNKTEGRSEAEKAAFSLKKNAERVKELGLNPADILGIRVEDQVITPDTPVTVGMLEQMRREDTKKTAIELAEGIEDPKERELTIHYLKTRIVPSGDAQDDLRFARQAVNSVKNGQIAEELARGTSPKNFSSGAGAPPKPTPATPELTPEELMFTRPPFNMTPQEVISKRAQ